MKRLIEFIKGLFKKKEKYGVLKKETDEEEEYIVEEIYYYGLCKRK